MVVASHVSHQFGSRRVLNDISFRVEAGEILVIMGSSGGGKTTLLKCIGGLIEPTEGEIWIDEFKLSENLEQARERIGFVFQYAALFDFLSVEDNILFGAIRKRKLAKSEATKTVEVLLQEVGLEGTQKLFPSELSGGMRKRVGLARALAIQPDVLLFDEPTSGLDPVTAYAIDQLIVQTRDHTGASCVVVSHDVSSVFRVADRIMFLDQGSVVFNGSPAEFRASDHDAICELLGKAKAEKL